jgi:hypothetical protein
VNEPIYRWECTICGASGESESSELARRTVNAHVATAHPTGSARPAGPADRTATEPGSRRSS